MKPLRFLGAVIVAYLFLPSVLVGQRRPIEIGIDASFVRVSYEGVGGGQSNDVTSLSIPDQNIRVGFFLSDLVSLETSLSHEYASYDGRSASDFGFGVGLQYHLNPPIAATSFFLGVDGGVAISDAQDDSDTRFGVGAQAGFKIKTGERFAVRLAAFFVRAFESDQRLAANGVGVSAGVSFFAR